MRALALVFVVGCSSTPVVERAPPLPITRPRVVAHRGASHDAPENTLAAFTRAWALGVECVELDVHVTRDGEVVVMHDANTKRITGHDGAIADQTLAALKMLDAGRGERIPTIGEAIATVPRGRTLFVELKSPIATVPAVAKAIRDADPAARGATIALQGFDPDALAAFSRALPDAPAYWTVDPGMDAQEHFLPYPLEIVDEAKRRGFAGIALLYVSVTDELLAEARGVGLEVDVWTINDPAPLAIAMARTDLRWIETDRPDLVAPR